jgi:hypothetical protein
MTAERSMRPLLLLCIFFSSLPSSLPSHQFTRKQLIPSSSPSTTSATRYDTAKTPAQALKPLDASARPSNQASIEQLRESVPTILQSVEDPDPTIRSVALIAVLAMNQRLILENLRTGNMPIFLNPSIPAIAAHLTDPDQSVRGTAVLALGSFGSPINDAFPPMIAYLKRDDAITTIGSAIVFVLAARVGHRSDVEDAIIAYLNRPDQTISELRNSIQAIAVQNAQSQRLALAILPFVDAADPTLSASTILNLPRQTFPEASFLTAKAHLQAIATDPTQPKIVRDAAAEILPCWINDRHKPCPQSTSSSPLPPP